MLTFAIALVLFLSLSDNQTYAIESKNAISPLAYDTYVNISPSNQTKTGSSSTFYWTTSHSGGNGVYWVTFLPGDGSRQNVSNYKNTSASWNHKFSLARGETQRTYTQTATINSTGRPGSATAKSTLKRF